jgi:hypothetical protein
LEELTKPQWAALEVLDAQDEPIGAWKRSSIGGLYPRVNIRAVGKLVQLKLAKRHPSLHFHWWSPYTHDDKYTITVEGRRLVGTVIRVEGGALCPDCGESYRQHPAVGEDGDLQGCDGRRLHL